ncbi:MAG: ABC transporter permease [Bacilli bacterium]|nr:ABC transporter permease [Bacilli bacterium]MBN2696163.1 ABC transporter permease [Bacilli bacterium]
MNKLWHLVKGEIFRLFRYKIVVFGIITSLIWVLIIALSDTETAEALMPTLILMDAGLMSIVLLAAAYFLERQEGTMHALLVTPVKLVHVFLAKIISVLFMSLISFVLVVGSMFVFHDFDASVLLLLLYTLLAVLSHSAIGYVLTLNSKDFMQLLARYMGMVILFFTPLLLVAIDIIPTEYDFLAMLSPTYTGQLLVNSTIESIDTWKIIAGSLYLFILTGMLYPLVVFPRFQKVALEG